MSSYLYFQHYMTRPYFNPVLVAVKNSQRSFNL